MAYTAPTPAEFKTRFTDFASLSDAVVQAALDEAGMMVDDSWLTQDDFTLGIMLYAAHILTLEGQGASAASLDAYKTIKSGSLTLERNTSATVVAGDIGSTSYGKRFQQLQERNRSGPIVARYDY